MGPLDSYDDAAQRMRTKLLDQPTTKRYVLCVAKRPYQDMFILSGPEEGYIGALTLRPGREGRFTINRDGVPFVITSGLDQVCSSLLDVVHQDKEWQRLTINRAALMHAEAIADKLLSGGFKPTDYADCDRAALLDSVFNLGYSLSEFMCLPASEHARIIASNLEAMSAELSTQPTVRVDGIGHLRNIRYRGSPLFGSLDPSDPSFNTYNSFCPASTEKFAPALERCLDLARVR